METFLIRALQLIMSLSLLVIIHEGGHFLFARLFKIRVEKFCLFFDPWFTLFKFKPKKSETEYAVGWLPLGGYVKIAGMIDESMDTEQMKQPAQPWEFRSKPAGQRLMVMIGGVLFNFLLALFIYSMILFKWGDSYVPLENMTYGMEFSERAQKIGFQDGDILLSADGKKLERFNMDMLRNIIEANEVTVLRDGKEVTVYVPEMSLLEITKDAEPFVTYRLPNLIDSVIPNRPAALAGLQKGDEVLAVNGKPVTSWGQFTGTLRKLQEQTGNADGTDMRQITLIYSRDGIVDTLSLATDSAYMIGVAPKTPSQIYKPIDINYSFFGSFPAGIMLGVNTLKGYVSDMKYVFTKEGANSLGGFGTIGSIFPKTWDWYRFWSMTAFLSIILAFMNILPIPALDGGHVLFLIYEMVTRRKPSDKFMEYAQMTGMVILFGLLLWANFNDIMRFIF
ncbi:MULTISPECIES: RIP metalloprotease RseP [unclassified Bacteroides]|jgi:regulator of sigma E protease|uniref:RIP metalloprotease RseP n=1 Tax=unclassified Bacteroides TaxID=2646097 RepID=UPI000E966914|nr:MULTISPECIES: RIP metalloprotease RseP [unclassified Bacteroides]RGN49906.1 RIP metalloprotease RseP [Bacteroides sp. OM05-12]RHR81500.1 RIP metalloprotease RseP [Bacteroides sp. AF16-49]